MMDGMKLATIVDQANAYTNPSCTIQDEDSNTTKPADATEDSNTGDSVINTLFKGTLFKGPSALQRGQ